MKTPVELGIKKGTYIIPTNGWEKNKLYIVDAAFSANNPIHRCYFKCGFINKITNLPGNYSGFVGIDPDDFYSFYEAYYIKPIAVIDKKTLTFEIID